MLCTAHPRIEGDSDSRGRDGTGGSESLFGQVRHWWADWSGSHTVQIWEVVQSLRKCLGLENQHTVFEGKVMGMILVAELIRAEGHVRSTVIGVDSQAALWATVGTGGTSGQHLLAKLQAHLALAQCRCSNAGIVLTWTPGHDGIHKNKRADEEAK